MLDHVVVDVACQSPPGFVAVEIGKGCVLVIPQRVYLAGLRLGKTLRRREVEAKRAARTQEPEPR
jgi:hypothetical protein